MKLSERLASMTHGMVYRSGYKEKGRKNPQDFTRKRKISFEELILFMLISLKRSTSSALRRFFADIGKTVRMKQQSLSEARSKVTVWAFVELFRLTAETMTEHCKKMWHNYRVYAVDGSKIALPSDKELLKYYGGTGAKKSSPTAQASALYDVLNDILVDTAIEPLTVDERTMALNHIEALENLNVDSKKLLLYDNVNNLRKISASNWAVGDGTPTLHIHDSRRAGVPSPTVLKYAKPLSC